MSCPACSSDKAARTRPDIRVDAALIECPTCGTFTITAEAEPEVSSLSARDRARLSGWLRERSLRGLRPTLCSSSYRKGPNATGAVLLSEVLDGLAPHGVGDQITRSLLNLAALSAEPGKVVMLSGVDRSMFFATSADEMLFCLDALESRGHVKVLSRIIPDQALLRVTPEGWIEVARLSETRLTSKQAFVAMAFHEELEQAWQEGLRPGVKQTGFDPLRIDKREHNEKICDLILAEIRKSRFLVADFTLPRGGVYFEAGFAMGLGLPVIWTCRKDALKDCHFDTRQYNHIDWESPEELAVRLKNRIEATIL